MITMAIFLLLGSICLNLQSNIPNSYYGIVRTIEWSHNGATLAVGGDYNLWLFDGDFEQQTHYSDFEGRISAISWSPDDSQLAILLDYAFLDLDRDTEVITLDSSTGEILTRMITDFFSTPPVWNPSELSIAIGDVEGILHIYDTSTGEELLTFEESVDTESQPNSMLALCWTNSQNQLVTHHFVGLYILDATTGNQVRFFRQRTLLGGTADCNPQGTVMVTTDGSYIDLESGNHILSWKDDMGRNTFDVRWDPDGSYFVTNSEDYLVEVWDAETGERLASLEGGGIRFNTGYNEYNDSLAWSPDGSMFAEAGQDGVVRIWDAETYELITILDFTE
jgi:WD40 repeat protein